MDKNIDSFIKKGIIHFMAYPETMKGEGPILETLEKIAEDDFFDVVEISWIKNDSVREKAKNILEASHLEIYYGAQPRLLTTGLNINSLDGNVRQQALDTLKEGIDEACYMGAKGFAFLSGRYENNTLEQSFNALVDSTEELCSYARQKGDIRVVLEVFDFDIDKKSIIGPAALAARYAREITARFDNFGLMVDLSHLPLLRESPEQSVWPVKDYLVHAHIGNAVACDKDNPAYGDAHPRFGISGGSNDVNELADFLGTLARAGYLKENEPRVVSFEVKPQPDEKPEIVIANAKRVLRQAWARM